MNDRMDDSPVAVSNRIRRILDEMRSRLDDHDDLELRNAWRSKWAPSLLKIVKEREHRPRVEIALVGGTGAGKSTLVNALLDARILPVSNMRACTAAISEIAYSAGPEYRASVEFLSRDEWHKEIRYLIADIRDAEGATAQDGDGDAVGIPKAAKDKLIAVYGTWDSLPRPLTVERLPEAPEIRDAFERGTIDIAETSLDSFRTRIREFLDSKCRYWPIVKTVRVSGPFPSLECGATLVDLPGINDPNEARENVTKAYLKQSQFVWIVFNIKRALTRDVSNLMQSDDFVRQIVMDGRANSLTFVGTASDDIDVDSAAEEFGLFEESSVATIARARNGAVRKEIEAQVADIAGRLARSAESPDRATLLRESFLSSRVFTVSARDYLALAGLAKNEPRLGGIDDTEVRQLRDHMIETCRAYGVEAQAREHHARINQVIHEITAAVAARTSAIEQQYELSASKRKELGEALGRLSTFLDRDLAEHRERFSQELNSGSEVLAERMKRATERGHHALEHVKLGWSRMHWATLRAVARRGGRYTSPTSGEHDFAADVSKPILDGITFAWTDFFGDRLTAALDKWSTKLVSLSERFGFDVLKELAALKLDACSKAEAEFKAVIGTTERVIAEQMGLIRSSMEQRIGEVRRTLYERIPEQVTHNMAPAFLQAADEKGTGMKQRMLDVIFLHASRVARDMFQDMEEQIGQGVRELNAWLTTKFGEMGQTVHRHSATPLTNLMTTEDMSAEEVQRRRAALSELAEAIKAIPLTPLTSHRGKSNQQPEATVVESLRD